VVVMVILEPMKHNFRLYKGSHIYSERRCRGCPFIVIYTFPFPGAPKLTKFCAFAMFSKRDFSAHLKMKLFIRHLPFT
jgi:hypothetical protein